MMGRTETGGEKKRCMEEEMKQLRGRWFMYSSDKEREYETQQ